MEGRGEGRGEVDQNSINLNGVSQLQMFKRINT